MGLNKINKVYLGETLCYWSDAKKRADYERFEEGEMMKKVKR